MVSLVVAEVGVLVGLLDELVDKAGALLVYEELRLAEGLRLAGALLVPVDVDFKQAKLVVQLGLEMLVTAFLPMAMKVRYRYRYL